MSGDVPCPHCGAFCMTPSSLKRHQKTNRRCRIIQEEAEFGRQGYTKVDYTWTRWNSDEKKRDRLEPDVLRRARKLGIQWFDAPRDRWYAFIETWFVRAYNDWPGVKPFDEVIQDVLTDERKLAVLKVHIATGTLKRYVGPAIVVLPAEGLTEQS